MRSFQGKLVFIFAFCNLAEMPSAQALDLSKVDPSENILDRRMSDASLEELKEEVRPIIQLGRALDGKSSDYWFNGFWVRSAFSACKLDSLKRATILLGRTLETDLIGALPGLEQKLADIILNETLKSAHSVSCD